MRGVGRRVDQLLPRGHPLVGKVQLYIDQGGVVDIWNSFSGFDQFASFPQKNPMDMYFSRLKVML